jgi:hypothetical protein
VLAATLELGDAVEDGPIEGGQFLGWRDGLHTVRVRERPAAENAPPVPRSANERGIGDPASEART